MNRIKESLKKYNRDFVENKFGNGISTTNTIKNLLPLFISFLSILSITYSLNSFYVENISKTTMGIHEQIIQVERKIDNVNYHLSELMREEISSLESEIKMLEALLKENPNNKNLENLLYSKKLRINLLKRLQRSLERSTG